MYLYAQQWNIKSLLSQYYVRARHMALKAVDVTYQIPSMGELTDMLENGPISHKVTNETDENLSTFYRAGPQQS